MNKISKLQNSLIWQPTKPASYISISITRKDKNNLMLDITPTKLIPRKKAKSRPKNKRLEEVNITFKNKVVVKNIEITADG
ncbi:MAG: hypothetical protein Q8K02_01615, partial [Flavobacterium sp.]|nr:hypothetical protein [Flavobacterium sp.]